MAVQGRKVKVIWIYGPAGVGKTSLAREYAEQIGQKYYISGSSRDPFERYVGEHTLILDELRPNVIPYQDLLRLTDPFGAQVMAPARYHDRHWPVIPSLSHPLMTRLSSILTSVRYRALTAITNYCGALS